VSSENTTPIKVGLTQATSVGLSPRWVHYSGVSERACALAEVLTDIATMNTHGDNAIELDRELLAYLIGAHANRTSRPLTELTDAGFLEIYTGQATPEGKRPDTFLINLEAPAEYTGPRNLTEVYAQFIADRDAAYQAVRDRGKRPRSGQVSIPRSHYNRAAFSQVNPDKQNVSQGSEPGDPNVSQGAFSQVNPDKQNVSQGSEPGDPNVSQGAFSQVNPDKQNVSLPRARRSDSSSLRSEEDRREERDSEPEAGRWQAPGTGSVEDEAAGVARDLVMRIPWQAWQEHTGKELVLVVDDEDQIAQAVAEAIRAGRVTAEQAEQILPAALVEATNNPVSFLVGAFKGKKLARWVRSTQVVDVSQRANTLPFPDVAASTPQDGHNTVSESAVAPNGDSLGVGAEWPEWCGECGDQDPRAEFVATLRRVPGGEGRMQRCPACHPDPDHTQAA